MQAMFLLLYVSVRQSNKSKFGSKKLCGFRFLFFSIFFHIKAGKTLPRVDNLASISKSSGFDLENEKCGSQFSISESG